MSSSFKSLSRVSRDFPVLSRPLMLALLPICLCACAGGGGGGLSAAGPVILVDGSDRFAGELAAALPTGQG